MKKIKNVTHSDTLWPVVASLALMVALLLLPTGFEGALSYQNADRVSALVLSTDESDIYDTGLVRTVRPPHATSASPPAASIS